MSPILGNLIVLALLIGAAALAVRSMWKDRKSGKSCGCGCDSCPGKGLCRSEK